MIYKIYSQDEWLKSQQIGFFAESQADLADGYMHFSTADQVRETAAKHFAHQADLVLVAVNELNLGDALRYEPSRGGDLFPHFYGKVPIEAALRVKPLPLGPDGQHLFPDFGEC